MKKEEKARRLLETAKMRRAIWEAAWLKAHPRTGVHPRPMPQLTDDQIRDELKGIVRGL